jgi:hypothetical protein
MARFFSTGDGVTDAGVAAAQRAYQSGAVLPTTTGVGDLEHFGICGGQTNFRSSSAASQPTESGFATLWLFTTVGFFGYRDNLITGRFSARPAFRWRWSHLNTDNQRVFVGISSTNLASTNAGFDDPAAAFLALQQRNGDTNWQFIHKPTSGGSITRVDTGVAIGTVLHDWEVVYDSATSVTVTLRDANGDTAFTSTITTGIPATSVLMTPTFAFENISGTASILTYFMNGHFRGSVP